MQYSDEQIESLRRKLKSFGRDVYARKDVAYQHFAVEGRTLIEGEHKERCAERIGWIESSDLRGKTVLDIGCNLGLFAMKAAGHQAKFATGIDIQPNVIAAGNCIREFLGLENCRLQVSDLTREEGRDAVESADIVFAFAIYDHLTGRHKQTPPSELEGRYVEVTEWLARCTREMLIVEFHNNQQKWADFFRSLLIEHGFAIVSERITKIDRPVFFCRRTLQAYDELLIDGETYHKLRCWNKRKRKLYLIEKNGQRFLCKRYSTFDLEQNCRPEQEARLLREFRDCPEVLQPLCFDDCRIVLPYFDGKPLEVIDEQPVNAAGPLLPALRLKIVASVTSVLARYLERQAEIFARFQEVIPAIYREEVKSGKRMLIDLSPSNILVSTTGEVRFVDFEPTKPALTRSITRHLENLIAEALGKQSNGGKLARLWKT